MVKQLKANVVYFFACLLYTAICLFTGPQKHFRNFPNQLLPDSAEGMETEDTKSCQHCSNSVDMSASHRCRCCHPGADSAGQCASRHQFIHQSHFTRHHHHTPLILAFVVICATSFVDGKNSLPPTRNGVP